MVLHAIIDAASGSGVRGIIRMTMNEAHLALSCCIFPFVPFRVNFGAKLNDNIREEWRDQYIDYKALKKALKPLKDARPKNWLAKGMSGYDASDSGR